MNTNKFLKAAKEAGLEAVEVSFSKDSSFSISLFRGEVSSYSSNINTSILARGIYEGKLGCATTEKDEASTIDYLINGIKETSKFVETDDEAIIFKGSEKYHKKNVFSKELEARDPKEILAKLHLLEDKLRTSDPKIQEVEVEFQKTSEETTRFNSYGLKLNNKANYYYVVGSVLMAQGEEIKNSYKIVLDTDPNKFDVDKIAKEIVEKCNSKFNGTTIKAKSYKAVLNPESVGSLIEQLVGNLSSEEVQKHSSVFEGKVGQKVLSSKLTVSENPLNKNPFFRYYDAEGVATYNKKVIDKGVIKTFFYNLLTAKKDGVESTGNAGRKGAKVGISFSSLVVKPGRFTEEELFKKIQNGVYITALNGLHAGLNAKSGDFSLEAEGFHVENGKKAGPLTLITCSGNLFELFSNIIAVGNNSELLLSSTTTPSIAFKKVQISAE